MIVLYNNLYSIICVRALIAWEVNFYLNVRRWNGMKLESLSVVAASITELQLLKSGVTFLHILRKRCPKFALDIVMYI